MKPLYRNLCGALSSPANAQSLLLLPLSPLSCVFVCVCLKPMYINPLSLRRQPPFLYVFVRTFSTTFQMKQISSLSLLSPFFPCCFYCNKTVNKTKQNKTNFVYLQISCLCFLPLRGESNRFIVVVIEH